jgi:serine/threonine protein kinase
MILANMKISHYSISSQLGAGGMGEVYRARDPRLNRDVAIKILPASFANDEDRLGRFEQEALATSALNHPNILTVYDIGTHEGAPYIVAELLEGEDLRAHLNRGPIEPRTAVGYAQQIASGLAAAHAKNVIHRDLKPENIFISTEGRVKILDFGLAKLRPQSHAIEAASTVQTLRAMTAPGTVMGTVGYMSPEQVRGEEVDHRSDIFSFGVLLHEMLRGRRTFTGESAIEVMNAILKDEPEELTETDKRISSALERIVRRCLEKKPERRFQSASDLGFALETLSMPSGPRLDTAALPALTETRDRSPLRRRERLAWIAAALLLITSSGFASAYFTRRPKLNTQVFKASILPPAKLSFGSFAVSPDGHWLAFTAAMGGNTHLWVRALDRLTAQILPDTEGATYAFWSPDSRSLGFFTGGRIKKVDVSGGPAQTLCSERQIFGGTWNRDGIIVFAARGGLWQISATGGTLTPLAKPDPVRQEVSYLYPFFLPDGHHFLYLISSTQKENRGIYLGSLDGTTKQPLVGDDSQPGYMRSPDGAGGYLLFAREGLLLAQPFDTDKPQLTGEPFTVAELGASGPNVSRPSFSLSENGVLVFDPSGNTQTGQLIWVDRRGNQVGSLNVMGSASRPALSPDEKRFVIDRIDPHTGNTDLWLYDATGENATRFTFDSANDSFPIWSPDGSRIVWASTRGGPFNLYQKAASGAGLDELLLKSDNDAIPNDWSADGRLIVYSAPDPKTRFDVWVLPLSGDQRPFSFNATPAGESAGKLSPDGRWIAYTSNESGTSEVYVQSFPSGGGKRQISTNGGAGPQWRGDGRELFYYARDGKLMAVTVRSGATFEAGAPLKLFEFRSGSTTIVTLPPYTVTADGQRFLINSIVETQVSAPLTVIVNWAPQR